jgi:hypothetical protein
MIKRLFLTGLLTGGGQLFSIGVLKLLSQKGYTSALTGLGQTDSLYQFLINIIALGLQSAAMRNIALQTDWQPEYAKTQSARMTLALLLLPIGFFAFHTPAYGIFFMVPLLALSGDYALYARGYPIAGSLVSFTRAALPYAFAAAMIWINPSLILYGFYGGLVLAFIITNIYMNRFLKTPFFYAPAWKTIVLYVKSLPLGLANLSFYFVGLGMLLVLPYFYSVKVVAVAFVGLKLHMIFKWVLRMIHQTFMKDMLSDEVCLKIDQLCSLIGLIFAGFVIIYPGTFIAVFVGTTYAGDKMFFLFLALSAFVYSLFSSITTKSLFEKKDNMYAAIAVLASLVAMSMPVILSFFSKDSAAVSICLLTAETIFALLMVFILSNGKYLKERVLFYAKNLAFLLLPLAIRSVLSDNLISFCLSLVLISIALVLFYRKTFMTLA